MFELLVSASSKKSRQVLVDDANMDQTSMEQTLLLGINSAANETGVSNLTLAEETIVDEEEEMMNATDRDMDNTGKCPL